MKLGVIIFSFAIVGLVAVMVYLGAIAIDAGVVFGMLGFFVPYVLEYISRPKVSLDVKNPQFVENTVNHVHGYQLKAVVTNEGRKICLNLEPSFEIKDRNNNSPNLLHVSIEEKGRHVTVVPKQEPMRDIGYAWIDKKNEVMNTHTLGELRQDEVGLLFPYETFYVASAGRGHFSSSSYKYFLKLQPNMVYEIVITVKGEDSERNTVIKRKKAKIKVWES